MHGQDGDGMIAIQIKLSRATIEFLWGLALQHKYERPNLPKGNPDKAWTLTEKKHAVRWYTEKSISELYRSRIK
jgi:hypothetical protein